MSTNDHENLSKTLPIAGAVAVAAVLSVAVVAWAIPKSQCQVPNPNTVFCTTQVVDTVDCTTYDGDMQTCVLKFDAYERNQFPAGAVAADAGLTMEAQADCSRTKSCVWDAATQTCAAAADWNAWFQADKTVVNPTGECPTVETP